MSIVDKSVQDGIGQGSFTDILMPAIDGELAGDESRAQAMAVLNKLHEVSPLGRGDFLDAPIVEDQELGLGQLCHQSRIAAVAMGDAQLFEETGQAKVAHGQPLSASLVAQGTGEPRFATAGGTCKQQILMACNPFTGSQSGHFCPLQPSGVAIVDFLNRSRESEFGRLQETCETPVLPLHGFFIEQHSETLFEGKVGIGDRLLPLQGERCGHAVESQAA